ncbi:MAG TPA: HAD-IA family hydrolase [Vicinamibacterales bacterium]|nr:HAD-IA family hydrolase [Acidobacteriota bacterium]HOC17933.1 HAD-IA family hydrolase [Vicinamibacterales bacterium]
MRAIFFDLVGTLVEPRGPVGAQYAAIARRHGEHADADALGAAFAREMASTPAVQAWGLSREAAEAAERGWWHSLVRRVLDLAGAGGLLDAARFEPFFDDLYRHFTTADAWRLYPDVLPALDRLETAGIATGLITNYDSRIYRLVESLGLASSLGSITIPASAGATKPARAIFGQALFCHRLAASEAGHVGDSLADDYQGALEAGLHAVLLDRDGHHAALAGVRRAGNLEEAVALLEKELG